MDVKRVTDLIFGVDILAEQKSMLLDVVREGEVCQEKIAGWNKRYYENLPAHMILEEDYLEALEPILGVGLDRHSDVQEHWPDVVDQNMYGSLHEALQIDFVESVPVASHHEQKYAVVLNADFWNIKTHNSNLLDDVINIYERPFDESEWVFDDEESAKLHGIVLMDILCNQRGPDNPYYYTKRLFDQVKRLPDDEQPRLDSMGIDKRYEVPLLNFDIYTYGEKRAEEYSRVLNEKQHEVKVVSALIDSVPEKPFNVVKLG